MSDFTPSRPTRTAPSENVFAICILALIVDFNVDTFIDAVNMVISLCAVANISVIVWSSKTFLPACIVWPNFGAEAASFSNVPEESASTFGISIEHGSNDADKESADCARSVRLILA